MTNPSIKPTIGRRVWFRPSAQFLKSNPTVTQLGADQPMDAGVVYVHHDHMVNLAVCDHVGRTHMVTSVPLLAGQWEPSDNDYMVCEWMPYQKSQSAKSEVSEKATSPPMPTQRDQLEYTLVSSAAPFIAQETARATAIAAGIRTVLDALHPAQAASMGHQAGSASLVLPVVDPGPASIEQEIQAKAKKAPRVTPADVDAAIASEFYFTAADGVLGESEMGTRPAAWTNLDQVTICVLVLCNGAKVLGVNYGAIDRAQHDAALGCEEARKAAVEKVWELLGFRLRDKLTAR